MVGAEGPVVAVGAVDDVGEVIEVGVEEAGAEGGAKAIGGDEVAGGGLVVPAGEEAGDGAQGVVPEGVDLDRFADAGGDDPIADLGIHPGELNAGLARAEETIGGIDADAVARAGKVVFDDLVQRREQVLDQSVVAGGGVAGADGEDVPEGGVGGVVAGDDAGAVREVVGEQPVGEEVGKRAEDVGGLLGATGGEGETGEGDHRVAAPVVEPVVAGDDGFAGGADGPYPLPRPQRWGRGGWAARNQELVGGEDELLEGGIGGGGVGAGEKVELSGLFGGE